MPLQRHCGAEQGAPASSFPREFVDDGSHRVADRWAGLVLRLVTLGPRRFNALVASSRASRQKFLAGVLKRMERDGLVSHSVFATAPVTVEYSVTPLGRTLDEAMVPVVNWAEANIDAVLAAKATYDTHQNSD